MTRAEQAYRDALSRRYDECADVPPALMRAVNAAWRDAERGPVSPAEFPLVSLIAQLILARDECPGEDHDWQHALLLASRAVRAAGLLAKRRTYKKPRKKRKRKK